MKPNTDDWFEPALVLGMVALFGVAMLAELGQHHPPARTAEQAAQQPAPEAYYAGTSREPRARHSERSVKESQLPV